MNRVFDYDNIVYSRFSEDLIINYGIIKGNSTIIFIKAGQDGSCYGYHDKYLKIAKSLNVKYGFSVICSSNPFNWVNPLDDAMQVIDNYCKDNNLNNYVIYYMGHSNGALIVAWFGVDYPKIKRMLLVNAPLMICFDKTKKGIMRFNGEKMVIVYGGLDQSFSYVDLLKPLCNDKIKLEIIDGQDHHFSNECFDFKKLPEIFLLD